MRISLSILTEFKRIDKYSLSNIWPFKEIHGKSTWRNKWNRKKEFVGCYAPWLKDGIFAVTNIGAEILMYTQMYVLVKAAFFLEGNQRSSLIIKKKEQKKQDKYFDETNKKSSGNIASSLWTRY